MGKGMYNATVFIHTCACAYTHTHTLIISVTVSQSMSGMLDKVLDLTYPHTSMFTGKHLALLYALHCILPKLS